MVQQGAENQGGNPPVLEKGGEIEDYLHGAGSSLTATKAFDDYENILLSGAPRRTITNEIHIFSEGILLLQKRGWGAPPMRNWVTATKIP
jgi:hypothetical protein